MKVLLINPPAMALSEMETMLSNNSSLRIPGFHMPMGLLEMSAYLRKEHPNVDMKILDMGKELYLLYKEIIEKKDLQLSKTVDTFIKKCLDTVDFQPDVIGVSILYSSSHNFSLKLIEKIKTRWKKGIVVCGGNHATNLHDQLLLNSNIDFVIRGEGELSLSKLVDELKSGNNNFNIDGVFNKDKLVANKEDISLMIQNLDEIPMPAYDLLDLDDYKDKGKSNPSNIIGASLMTSRGCSFQCSFCATRTVHGRKVRYFSNDKILEQLKYLINDKKFKTIIIEDDLFAANKKKFLDLVDQILKEKFTVKFFLPQGLSVGIMNEEVIDAMIKMGIDEASIAIESGSKFTQKNLIKKNIDLEKANRILKYFRKNNFKIYVNFILGFPDETKELMSETIEYMKTLDVDWIFIFHLMPLPGSDDFQKFVSRGIINKKEYNWDGVRLGRRTFDTPEISAKELEELVYDTNIRLNFIDNSNVKNGRFERAIEIFSRSILSNYPFHVVARYFRAILFKNIGEKSRYIKELEEIVRWIETNMESKRLYERYSENMPELKPYMAKICQ